MGFCPLATILARARVDLIATRHFGHRLGRLDKDDIHLAMLPCVHGFIQAEHGRASVRAMMTNASSLSCGNTASILQEFFSPDDFLPP